MSLEVFETEPITEAESKILTSVFQNGTVRKYLKLLAFTASADAVSMPLPTNTGDRKSVV